MSTSFVSKYYYSKLWSFWDEFACLIPPPIYDCEKTKKFVEYWNMLRVMQSFNRVKWVIWTNESSNFVGDHIPHLNQAYSLVIDRESQKVITNSLINTISKEVATMMGARES